MNRPVIGIPSPIERAIWGPWEGPAHVLSRGYVDAVQRAGGAALILPADPVWVTHPDEVLDRVDALLLAGGADVDPQFYGAEPHEQTSGTAPERDTVEIALARRALERDMPLLGICRGMQVLNVALGGTLHQHLQHIERHRTTPGVFGEHEVELEPGSLAARAVGDSRTVVKSHHHQAVERLGDG